MGSKFFIEQLVPVSDNWRAVFDASTNQEPLLETSPIACWAKVKGGGLSGDGEEHVVGMVAGGTELIAAEEANGFLGYAASDDEVLGYQSRVFEGWKASFREEEEAQRHR